MTYFFIILIVCFLIYITSFYFRLIIDNPINLLKYIIIDSSHYFRYKWIPKKPFINVYVGLFGQGKTLSAVHDALDFYHTYNNRKVYDDRFNRWTTQKVFILSNVDLKNVKYRKLKSLDQLNKIAKWRHITDLKHNVRTITIVILDEASTQLNSRNFKSNFSTQTLGTLLTSRHALIHGFYLTSQRFSHCDALLRQVSNNVIQCSKKWRLQKLTYYDAWVYENSPRPADAPYSHVTGFFVKNEDYAAYDTLAVVDQLIKDQESGNMMTDKEILDNRGSSAQFYPESGKKKKGRKK